MPYLALIAEAILFMKNILKSLFFGSIYEIIFSEIYDTF